LLPGCTFSVGATPRSAYFPKTALPTDATPAGSEVATSAPSTTPQHSPARIEDPDPVNESGSANLADLTTNIVSLSSLYLEKLGLHVNGEVELANIPLVDQPDYTSCGEAAFAMAWNYQHPNHTVDVERVESAGLRIGVYFPANVPGPHGYEGTSPAGMQTLGGYYADIYHTSQPLFGNLDLDQGDAYAQLEARGLLFRELSASLPVLIEVTDILGSPSSDYNDSHYILVTGLDLRVGTVTFNDPYLFLSTSGSYTGRSRTAAWNDLWASWSRNRDILPGTHVYAGRGWYMVIH